MSIRQSAEVYLMRDDEGVDLTPMLDVVFIMLIFFIVTAVFIKEIGVEVYRPTDSSQPIDPVPDTRPVVIAIAANGRLSIDKQSVDIRSLRARIESEAAQSPESGVIIVSNKHVEMQRFTEVLDAARQVVDPTRILLQTR